VSETKFSNRILRRFVETVTLELGADQFTGMLALAKLPAEWAKATVFLKMDPLESAQAYATLQAALRTYFGRGARGVLLRVGQRLWHHLLQDAALGGKAQAAVVKRLPLSTRRKSTLELLARLAVHPSAQGRGAGKALLNELFARLTQLGVPKLTVNTQSDNDVSLSLYQKMGFMRTGEQYPVYTSEVSPMHEED